MPFGSVGQPAALVLQVILLLAFVLLSLVLGVIGIGVRRWRGHVLAANRVPGCLRLKQKISDTLGFYLSVGPPGGF
jgi:hypothetical protein